MSRALLVLATGGTIAGTAGSAIRRDYRPGQIGIERFLAQIADLGIDTPLIGKQIANIGSENIGPDIWATLHDEISAALADPDIAGIIITHGTDTAEETAFALDLTLPTHKPVVLVGAMRAADAVGSDGLRNFANAVRVAGDTDAAGRGVLVVMGDRVFAARDVRKAHTESVDAFRGFPRGAIAMVSPSSLEWFGAPWRADEAARFAWPEQWPKVDILFAHAGMGAADVAHCLSAKPAGVVIAGFGTGNMPDTVRAALADAAHGGVPVVRASRVDEGLVDREPEDGANGFAAARAIGPAKARILLQLLLASGANDAATIQAAFDLR